MSTHLGVTQSAQKRGAPAAATTGRRAPVSAELAARVILARREVLLRVHSRHLGREDLEDCFSQAALELLTRARKDAAFASPQHVINALNQKLISRIYDRRRALSGRSAIQTALARASSTDDFEGEASRLPDDGLAPDELVARRAELARIREISHELSHDQQLWLAMHGALGVECDEFCRIHDWSAEKFRKVGQRARRRLALLLEQYASGERCRRFEADLPAVVTRPTPQLSREQAQRLQRHLTNCPSCRRRLAQLRADRTMSDVPAARGRSDQPEDPIVTPDERHLRVPLRDGQNCPRSSRSVPIHVHGGRSGALAALRPVVHASPVGREEQ